MSTCPVGLVTMSWRPPTSHPGSLLGQVYRLGYDGVQIGETFPAGEDLRELLAVHRLRAAEVYAALPATPQGPTEGALELGYQRLALLDRAGGDVLVVALDGVAERDAWAGRSQSEGAPSLTEEGWRRLREVAGRLAEEAGRRGRKAAFHPHAGTYVERRAEVERLLEVTAGTEMGICLDTGHDLLGGGDPTSTLAMVGPRLTHLHLKDVDPRVLETIRREGGLARAVNERVFCPLGSGALDLAGVLRGLTSAGYTGWLMVEQDTTWEPPAEAAAISRRVLDWAVRHLESPAELRTPRRAEDSPPG